MDLGEIFKLKAPKDLKNVLLDDSVPFGHRKQLMLHFCFERGGSGDEVLKSILSDARSPENQESIFKQKTDELAGLIEQMKKGPLRQGPFMRMLEGSGLGARAQVLLEDGASAYVVVPDAELADSLRVGDGVLLESQGSAVLFRDAILPGTGEAARLERCLDTNRIEVSLHGDERRIVLASALLMDRIGAGEVTPGRQVLVCPRRNLAFDAVPGADGFAHFRYLCRETPPDVRLDRDLGAPPGYVTDLLEHVRLELTRPELRRRYRLPRCVTTLLSGVSGTGKSYSLLALWRELYEAMAEVTDVAVHELPPRVFRLRTSEILSKWLGDSEKHLARFFDEVEAVAAEPFQAPDGATYTLPVLVVLEEIDGLGRARGHEANLDRILTTMLRRLDPARPDLQDRFILFVATTNVADQVDPALLRRVSGRVERFGRLRRRDFIAVLETHLRGRPLRRNGSGSVDALHGILADVAGWLFGDRDADPGQVDVSYQGSANPDRKYRRDFLTASVVDRAVQAASARAVREEEAGSHEPGVTAGMVMDEIDRVVRGIVEQLQPSNVRQHVDIPDGVRVATVRRVPQASVQPHHLERVA